MRVENQQQCTHPIKRHKWHQCIFPNVSQGHARGDIIHKRLVNSRIIIEATVCKKTVQLQKEVVVHKDQNYTIFPTILIKHL